MLIHVHAFERAWLRDPDVTQVAISCSHRLSPPLEVNSSHFASKGCATGFSLVEVLVAVLVVTIGMLGLAALQITGLKVTEGAQLRTLATLAVYDAGDRLRADPMSLISKTDGTHAMPASTCSKSITATGAVKRWYEDFCALGLPQPNKETNAATIDCGGNQCGTGNCEIVVHWDDSRAASSAPRDAGASPPSGDTSFRVCTRIPLQLTRAGP